VLRLGKFDLQFGHARNRQNCHGANLEALSADSGQGKRATAEILPSMVSDSQRRFGSAPEACAVPELVREKGQVERELLEVVAEEPATTDKSFYSYYPGAGNPPLVCGPCLQKRKHVCLRTRKACNSFDKEFAWPSDVVDQVAKEVRAIDIDKCEFRVINKGASRQSVTIRWCEKH
jgi:hypothetical protein